MDNVVDFKKGVERFKRRQETVEETIKASISIEVNLTEDALQRVKALAYFERLPANLVLTMLVNKTLFSLDDEIKSCKMELVKKEKMTLKSIEDEIENIPVDLTDDHPF